MGPAMEGEKRKHLRIYYSVSVEVSRADGSRVKGSTVDVSAGGFQFLSDGVLEPGERISTRIRFPNGRVYPVEGVIVNVRRRPEDPTRYHVMFTPETAERLSESIYGD
jgi:hypothetical protein